MPKQESELSKHSKNIGDILTGPQELDEFIQKVNNLPPEEWAKTWADRMYKTSEKLRLVLEKLQEKQPG